MIGNLMGGDGLIVIIVALVVLVGGSQLPKIARNVGLAGKEFRKAQSEAEEEQAKEQQRKAQAGATVAPPAPLPPSPAPPVASPAPPGPSAAPPVQSAGPDTSVTARPADDASINLTPAQLDALLKAREQQVRNEAGLN